MYQFTDLTLDENGVVTSVQNSWTVRFVPPVFLVSLRKQQSVDSDTYGAGYNGGIRDHAFVLTNILRRRWRYSYNGTGGTYQEFDRLADDGRCGPAVVMARWRLR